MSSDRESVRGDLGREAARLIRTDDSFRAILRFEDGEGGHPVLIALTDDAVKYVFDKLENDYPQGANVLVSDPRRHGGWANIVVDRVKEVPGVTASEDNELEVSVASPVGMLLAYLVLHRGETTLVRPTHEHGYQASLQLDGANA